MLPERVEKLKQEYAGQYVVIDTECAELARLKDIVGRVRTVNFNGRVLVEFDGPDRAWYDLELDYLKVVDKSQSNGSPSSSNGETSASTAKKTPTAEPEPNSETAPIQKLSRLELARLQKPTPESEAKPNAGKAPPAK